MPKSSSSTTAPPTTPPPWRWSTAHADTFRKFLHLLPDGFSYRTTSIIAFFLTGLGYYGYTCATMHRFTNMSTLLFSAAVIIFLIGLISEQITSLTYRRDE